MVRRLLIALAVLALVVGGLFGVERLSQVREKITVTVESTDGVVTTPTRNIVVRGGDQAPIARTTNIPAGQLTVRGGGNSHTMYLDIESYAEIRVGDELEVCAVRHRLLGFTELLNSPSC